ncbi:MAG: hypothetical protein ACREMQ_22425, partial [Longimicrobiales bacterium]
DIISEIHVTHPQVPSYTPHVRLPDAELVADATRGDESALERLTELMSGRRLAAGTDLITRIQAAVSGDAHIIALQDLAGTPRTYEELAAVWQERVPAAELTTEQAACVVEALVLLGSIGDNDRPPLLRPKLHSFFHGVYDVGLCMNPGCRTLIRDGHDYCPRCRAVVRPAVLCRTCGQDFVKVKWDSENSSRTIPNDEFLSDENTAFIASRIMVEEGDEDDDSAGSAPRRRAPARRRATTSLPRWGEAWVEHDTGVVSCEPPLGTEGWSRQWVLRGKGSSCPVCKASYSRGDTLTLLRTGQARASRY